MSDTPAVSTVQVIDPRIEPQPEPVYANTIGPDQNQFYKIPASGISDTYVTFNNLTTLGKDRAYLDTFELEITVDVKFKTAANSGWAPPPHGYFMPVSFPFNSVCEQARININGGAFFNSPMSTIRAKERYWDDEKLQESFANHTPCEKAYLQDELCFAGTCNNLYFFPHAYFNHWRTRMFGELEGYASRPNGPLTTTNFSILDNYTPVASGADPQEHVLTVTWREPIFCSPFSSRYDATYGRPLYNITSIDLAFNLVDLRNMFLYLNRSTTTYEVHFREIQLCYQVLTVTAPLNHSFTVVPYRRYVPYITDIMGPNPDGSVPGNTITPIRATSGVYTLNEVPTAIWIFLAPSLSEYQRFEWDGTPDPPAGGTAFYTGSTRHTNNKLFGFLKHISISCGNTTQILNTASIYDLYRIAKANGCMDNFEDWTRANPFDNNQLYYNFVEGSGFDVSAPVTVPGCGSVLRLIPGTDIVLPEQKLTPGSNANNLVFQVEAEFDFNGLGDRNRKISLWLLFEYVGVASITPGNCVVTMNPLGNGAIMAAAPTISGTTSEREAAPSTTEGSGWLDKIKSALGVANKLAKDTKIVSSALKYIPGVGEIASNIASQFGYGYKRPHVDGGGEGGAVMGLGDFC